MKLRKTIALMVLAATVAGCASPQYVTRGGGYYQGIDQTATVTVMGLYR